jgi:hypothetical protein
LKFATDFAPWIVTGFWPVMVEMSADRVDPWRCPWLAAADVDDDLVELGDLHDALVAELLHQSGSDFFFILSFKV